MRNERSDNAVGAGLRVAIVGAGPSGFYAADQLLDAGFEVDLYRRAADAVRARARGRRARPSEDQVGHARLRRRPRGTRASASSAASSSATRHHARRAARALPRGRLRARHVGRQPARDPGRGPPGSHAATEFVAWYNGHPDARRRRSSTCPASARSCRQRQRRDRRRADARADPDELAPTDTADHAIEALARLGVEEVVMLGRRGPAQAAFTNPELRELGELSAPTSIVDPADLDARRRRAALGRGRGADPTRRNVEILRELRGAAADGHVAPRRAPLPALAGRDPRRGRGRPRHGVRVVHNAIEARRRRPPARGRHRRARRSSSATSCSARSATAASRSPTSRSTSAAA